GLDGPPRLGHRGGIGDHQPGRGAPDRPLGGIRAERERRHEPPVRACGGWTVPPRGVPFDVPEPPRVVPFDVPGPTWSDSEPPELSEESERPEESEDPEDPEESEDPEELEGAEPVDGCDDDVPLRLLALAVAAWASTPKPATPTTETAAS